MELKVFGKLYTVVLTDAESYLSLCMCFYIRMWSVKMMVIYCIYKISSQRPSSAVA